MYVVECTTNPGLEDLVGAELRGLGLDAAATLRPDGLAGHVHLVSDDPLLWDHARRLRSVHRVVRPIAEVDLPPTGALEHLRAAVAEAARGIPELADDGAVFRVRCKRLGEHPFTSEDVERVGGAGVRDVWLRPVRLTGAAVVVRCDVVGPRLRVGVEAPPRAVVELPFRPSTSLRESVAWALLELAFPAAPPRRLLDPFVGGGTILTEAAARWPEVALCGSDLHHRCADGVRQNLAAWADRSTTRVGDARELLRTWPDHRFDAIVTNPPWGHRLGRDLDIEALYRVFLRSATEVATDDCRLVVLALRRGAFNRALGAARGWETRHVRIVELGGLYAGAFVLGRR
ncbi:MAG: THUMP domain-containing protein [Myxococcota bacterium]